LKFSWNVFDRNTQVNVKFGY